MNRSMGAWSEVGSRARGNGSACGARGQARSMASGECRFSPCSNQQDCRPCNRHTRRRPCPHIPIGARRDRKNPTRPLRILMENRQQHRDSARHRNHRQAMPLNIVAHLLMLMPVPGTFLIVMFMPRRLVIVAVLMMRPVAMILRRPLPVPCAITPIPTRHAERLRTQQRRAAKHGQKPEVWQGAVHAGLSCATKAVSSSASFGCVRVCGRRARGLRGPHPSAGRRRSARAGRGPWSRIGR